MSNLARATRITFLFASAILLLSNCQKEIGQEPWESIADQLTGKWKVVSNMVGGSEDRNNSLIGMTMEFTPSQLFPQEGKYTKLFPSGGTRKGEYLISTDGKMLTMVNVYNEVHITEKTLTLLRMVRDRRGIMQESELILIRI
jgi:hypothetical protein